MTHICVSKLTTIGSDNGLLPGRREAIIWSNAGILVIGPLETNFSEIWIEMQIFSFKKTRLKMSSGKWRPFCLGLKVLNCGFVLSFVPIPSSCHGRDIKRPCRNGFTRLETQLQNDNNTTKQHKTLWLTKRIDKIPHIQAQACACIWRYLVDAFCQPSCGMSYKTFTSMRQAIHQLVLSIQLYCCYGFHAVAFAQPPNDIYFIIKMIHCDILRNWCKPQSIANETLSQFKTTKVEYIIS